MGYFTDGLRALGVTLTNMLRPAATVEYPKVIRPRAERYRSSFALLHDADGDEACIGCLQCERICPSQVIAIKFGGKRESPITGKKRGYADDFVLAFSEESDARRVYEVLPKRLAKYGLTIHPEKTRLLDFRRPAHAAARSTSASFDFLGFTHFWARSRRGAWVVKRSTSKDRLTRSLKRIRQWCRAHRHDSIREQHQQLCAKVRGHYSYYGVTFNARRLQEYYRQVRQAWRYWLNRRSQNAKMTWARFAALERLWPLPAVRIVHSYIQPAAT